MTRPCGPLENARRGSNLARGPGFADRCHIASMNNVVVTVLYLLRALHRRIIVYRKLSKIQHIRASLATAIYGNKMLDCLLSGFIYNACHLELANILSFDARKF